MQIGIIGATGHIGQGITKAALAEGHDVTAFVRNALKARDLFGPAVAIVEKDALALTRADLAGLDVVIDAFASIATPTAHLDLATKLIGFFRGDTRTRLIFIIGASSLHTPDGNTLLADLQKQYADQPWLAGMVQQNHELAFLQWVDDVQWTAVTPSSEFTDGPKTAYKLGGSELMTGANGKSEVSVANFAAAIMAEIKDPQHIRQQFAVVDAEVAR
ncbi:NAD(P)-dependent oxidoreductase [Lacticaseibacillus sp. GG6-2]